MLLVQVGGRRFGLVAAAAAALALAGCVSPAFRDTVGEYGELTKATAADQAGRLATVAAEEEERIRTDLAARRVDLRLSPACATQLTLASVAGTAGTDSAAACTLVERGGKPIEPFPDYRNIEALGGALSGYADNLILLAADSTQDQEKFREAVTGLGTSLGELDGAARTLAGAQTGTASERIGPVAAALASAGNLYFAQRRGRMLKRIILASDPVVQEAVRQLAAVDDRLAVYERAALARQLLQAQNAASAAAADGAGVRAAQDELFAALAAYNAHGAAVRPFRAIGEAHARLALAAQRGASAGELKAAIEAVIELAGAAHAAVKAVEHDGGKDGDGD